VFWTPQRKSSISLGNPTLHKPHVATHCRQEFVDTNITGTLNLLEESVAARVESFIYTSTTSVLGEALVPLQALQRLGSRRTLHRPRKTSTE
jgi:nucleoside-diphosphate-sugar epimerase